MGEMADQQFVDEVDGPEDIMDDQQDQRVVIKPTDHQRIEAEDEIDDAGVSVHDMNIAKKSPAKRGFFF
jgi:hypothetical protein